MRIWVRAHIGRRVHGVSRDAMVVWRWRAGQYLRLARGLHSECVHVPVGNQGSDVQDRIPALQKTRHLRGVCSDAVLGSKYWRMRRRDVQSTCSDLRHSYDCRELPVRLPALCQRNVCALPAQQVLDGIGLRIVPRISVHGKCGDVREQHHCGDVQCWVQEVGQRNVCAVSGQ